MKRIVAILFIVSLVCTSIWGGVVYGEVKNLSVDQGVTAKIKAFDKGFFKRFDVYSAGSPETSTALLFDRKDQQRLPAGDWVGPLGEKEIGRAINSLSKQYQGRSWYVPLKPRALNIVNSKGEVLGYVFTGAETIETSLKLKVSGSMVAYPPFQNLATDQRIAAKIEAFDENFFKYFDAYTAGTQEEPIAILFDRKDQYHLPAAAWEKPLPGVNEIIYALRRLSQMSQDQEHSWKIPLRPRALNIVNTKGDVLGYVYFGLETIQMDRETDGRVTVHMPVLQKIQGGGGGGGGR